MDLRALECFVAVAEELHFRRAAARVNLTQPALSMRIRALETSLGIALFDRDRRHVRLTNAGVALLDHARAAVRHVHAGRDAVRLVASGRGGRLRLGFSVIALHGVVPRAVRTYRARYPEVEIALRELNSPDQERALAAGDIDVGVLHPPLVTAGLATAPLAHETLVLALPADHSLAKQPRVSVRDIAGEPFLIAPRAVGPHLYDAIVAVFHRHGVAPNIVQEATPVTTLLGLVEAGIGIGFVPAAFSSAPRPGAVFRPLLEPAPRLPLAAAWRENEETAAVRNFVAVLRSVQAPSRGRESVRGPVQSSGKASSGHGLRNPGRTRKTQR